MLPWKASDREILVIPQETRKIVASLLEPWMERETVGGEERCTRSSVSRATVKPLTATLTHTPSHSLFLPLSLPSQPETICLCHMISDINNSQYNTGVSFILYT